MSNYKKDSSDHENDGALKEKTNQDYNKQQPDPNDPNQVRNQQIGDREEREIKKKERNATENNNSDYRKKEQKVDFMSSLSKRQNQNFNKGRM